MLQAQSRPSVKLQTGCKSSFFGGGITRQLQRLTISTSRARAPLEVSASGRVCQLTGKKANNGYNVTFSHIRNKKKQQVNLQRRRVYWPEGKRWVKLRLSTTAIKTLETKGLQTMAKEIGLDLNSLPYNDVSKNRLEWLKENSKGYPAANKKTVGKSRRMKNPEKLAASKKKPLVPRYLAGGSVILTRDPRYVEEYRE